MADRGGARLRLLAFFTLHRRRGDRRPLLAFRRVTGFRRRSSTRSPVSASGAAIIFNDSLLVDVAAPARIRPRLGLRLCARLCRRRTAAASQRGDGHESGGLRPRRRRPTPCALSFPMVGAWWLLFTIPCLLWVREQKRRRAAAAGAPRRAPGWRELRATVARGPQATARSCWFLLAYWLYIDGVNTIIKMAVDLRPLARLPAAEPDRGAPDHAVRRLSGGARIRLARQPHRRPQRHLHRDRDLRGGDGRRLPHERGRALLRARRRHRPRAGRHPVAVALVLRGRSSRKASRASSSASTT